MSLFGFVYFKAIRTLRNEWQSECHLVLLYRTVFIPAKSLCICEQEQYVSTDFGLHAEASFVMGWIQRPEGTEICRQDRESVKLDQKKKSFLTGQEDQRIV